MSSIQPVALDPSGLFDASSQPLPRPRPTPPHRRREQGVPRRRQARVVRHRRALGLGCVSDRPGNAEAGHRFVRAGHPHEAARHDAAAALRRASPRLGRRRHGGSLLEHNAQPGARRRRRGRDGAPAPHLGPWTVYMSWRHTPSASTKVLGRAASRGSSTINRAPYSPHHRAVAPSWPSRLSTGCIPSASCRSSFNLGRRVDDAIPVKGSEPVVVADVERRIPAVDHGIGHSGRAARHGAAMTR